jgi:hypothetical protein
VRFAARGRTIHGKLEAAIGRDMRGMAMHDLNAA